MIFESIYLLSVHTHTLENTGKLFDLFWLVLPGN